MNINERSNMWADRIERCLSSDLSIEQWCHLNHVCRSTLYKWMAEFRKSEPGRFPRRSSVASNWISVTRDGIADTHAIIPSTVPASAAPSRASKPDVRFPTPETDDKTVFASQSPASLPIRALVGNIELAIPPGTHESDIASVMRAAMVL